MTVDYPLCVDCAHLDLINEVDGKPICKAYPNGIPKDIIIEKSKPNVDKAAVCNNVYKFKEVSHE